VTVTSVTHCDDNGRLLARRSGPRRRVAAVGGGPTIALGRTGDIPGPGRRVARWAGRPARGIVDHVPWPTYSSRIRSRPSPRREQDRL